jgi:hypothetical protein
LCVLFTLAFDRLSSGKAAWVERGSPTAIPHLWAKETLVKIRSLFEARGGWARAARHRSHGRAVQGEPADAQRDEIYRSEVFVNFATGEPPLIL